MTLASPPLTHAPSAHVAPVRRAPAGPVAPNRNGGRLASGEIWARRVAILLTLIFSFRYAELFPALRVVKPLMSGLALSFLILAATVKPSQWKRLRQSEVMIAVLWYVLGIFLSLPFAEGRRTALEIFKAFIPSAVAFVVVVLLIRPRLDELDRFAKWLCAALAAIATMWLLRGMNLGDRLGSGGMYDPNDTALLLVTFVPIFMGLLFRPGTGIWRLLGLGGGAVCILTISFTGSRGGMIGLVLGIAAFVFSQKPARALVVLALISVAGALLFMFGPATFRERMATMTNLESDYNSNSESGRIAIWKRSLRVWVGRPITGVGVGNVGNSAAKDLWARGIALRGHSSHNSFVQVLAETGIVGFAAFMMLLWRIGTGTFLLYRPKPGPNGPGPRRPEYFAAFLAFLGAATFLSHGYSTIFFTMVGVCGLAAEVGRASMRAGSRAPAASGARSMSRGMNHRGRPSQVAFRPT